MEVLLGSPQEAVEIVLAVEESIQRINRAEYPTLTYFSVHDHWQYFEQSDMRVCGTCHFNSTNGTVDTDVFSGDWLRNLFPYLMLSGADRIEVLQHPNCRCYLKRVMTNG